VTIAVVTGKVFIIAGWNMFGLCTEEFLTLSGVFNLCWIGICWQLIDEFTDVNEGEKELMKLWNVHVMHNK